MEVSDEDRFHLRISVHANWYYKNGKMKKQDIQNMDKLLVDALFQKLGCDDSRLWYMELDKVQDEKEYTIIELEKI